MGNISRIEVKKHEANNQNFVSKTRKPCCSKNRSTPADNVLFLQRMVGNQAVGRLIRSGTLRAKLKIGQPGDKYEQEADRVADTVIRMPEPLAVSSDIPYIQRTCPKCEEDEVKRQPIKEEDEEKKLQRKPVEGEEEKLQAKADSGISEVNPDIESHIQSLKGGGKPLSENELAFFEPRFGHDFCDVRIHADTRAANMARSVSARAFTLGRSIAFGEHEYAPGSSEGRRLLAHELTHVIQQGGAGTIKRQVTPDAGTPAPCPVTPITPITDADALAMEGGTRVIWNNTAANLQTCANNLVGLIQGAGGTAVITSAYRPQAYQDHLREVWDKARALQSHPETACNTVRAAVNAEMANHSLDVNRAVAQISNHRAGNAVDIGWTLPAALTNATCQIPVPDGGSPVSPTEEQCIDSLAGRAGLSHPLHAGDRPHFEI